MDAWPWILLACGLKVVLAAGPFVARSYEFNLGSDAHWREAKDVASVSSCRSMLASLPVMLALVTYAETEKLCDGRVYALPTIVLVLLVALAAVGSFLAPPTWFRGKWPPIRWLVVLVVVEAIYTLNTKSLATRLCA